MNRTWQPATIADEAATARNKRREELATNTGPIDYTLTPDERAIATRAMLDVISMQRENAARAAASFTPGLVVTIIPITDLTAEERKSFGLEQSA